MGKKADRRAEKRGAKRAAKRLAGIESRAYEAAMSTPSRRHVIGADQSQDAAAQSALPQIRDWGRYLDENHDLASGVLDELVKAVVGQGIVTIPKPLRSPGNIDTALAADITEQWRRWVRRCDVTGQLHWHEAQRLIARAWFRDGEEFVQHVSGRDRGYPFATADIPYRIEMLESDMVPVELTDDVWRQGVRLNPWRMPIAYAVYKNHPGDSLRGGSGMAFPTDPASLKTVSADQITHLKYLKRWPATRGISVFSSVISRLYDIKDLEESERIKNRVLASWCAAITRAPDAPGADSTDESGRRYTGMAGGTLIDDLAPGEDITGVGPEYPIANMPDHITDQIRRVSSGTGARHSSISRNYTGTYASQRQEMVESQGLYQMREDTFVQHMVRVVYERWLTAAILSGAVRVSPLADFDAVANAEYRGPVTPWIDPLKEVQADALAVESGFVTLEQVQIKRGASPEIIGKAPPAPAQPAAAPTPAADDDDEEMAA